MVKCRNLKDLLKACKGPLQIGYHGTTKKNADSILKTGFRKGTYFARHLEDAVGFGGIHVFEAAFCTALLPDDWQFVVEECVNPDRVVSLTRYSKKKLDDEPKLRDVIFNSQEEP